MAMIGIIRLRGMWSKAPKVRQTFEHLKLQRLNCCSVYSDTPSLQGMLRQVKDYATWGEIDAKSIEALVSRRAMIGNRKFSQAGKEGKLDAAKVAAEVYGGKKRLADFGITPYFRLTPPTGGHGRIKLAFPAGALGPRPAADFAALLKSMI